jgi:S1-C subfamily serine protease
MAFDQTSDLALLFPVGTISALAGLWNDRRMIQISTPVQPGNSGSPLLDQSGNVVGIVAGKLNAIQVAETRSETTQNINFAVNLRTIQSFLDSHAVPSPHLVSTNMVPTTKRPSSIRA